MSDALLIAIGTVLIQAGILVASVFFLQKKQDEQYRQIRADLNGLGKKERSTMAETIILAKEHPEFSVIVRKLINGI
jgi:uncharacterized membrane protein